MIVSKLRYLTLASGGALICNNGGKLKRVEPATSKSGFTNGPVTIRNEHSGEIQERETFVGRENKCPIPEGTVKTIRYRDPETDEVLGGITAIVTEAVFAEMSNGEWKWRITFHRCGPHRPIPDTEAGIYLASGQGYASRSKSIDPEAPVIPDEDVRRVRADELAAKRDMQRRSLDKLSEITEAIGEGEHDTTIRRSLKNIDETAARLRAMLDEDGIEAA